MLRLLASILIILALTGQVWGQGIDQVYRKPAGGDSWGTMLAQFFGRSGYNESYALVIGVSSFDHFGNLPTGQDPIRMKDFLIDEAGFDYVHLLTEDKVTYARVRALMEDEFPGLLDGNDRFLFYWSGHGITRGLPGGGQRGYLPLGQSRAGQFAGMVSMSNIREWDDNLEAEQVLYLLDACFSGLAGNAPMAVTDFQRLRIDQLAQPSRHILTAGTEDEETIAIDRLGGSVFTAAVLDGLRGDADSSTVFPNDGLVSVNELKHYVNERVLRERSDAGWQRSITPQLRDLGTSNGEFFFITSERLEEASATPEPLPPDERTILEAQEILAGLGYEPGLRDGILGLRTQGAIRRFQSESGLSATGALDAATQAALINAWAGIPRAIGMGATPDETPPEDAQPLEAEIAEPDPTATAAGTEAAFGLDRQDRVLIQRALQDLGFDPGPADGVLGSSSRAAIRDYQAGAGAVSTGYLNRAQASALLDHAAALQERERPVAAQPVTPAPSVRRPGDRFEDCADCPELVVVPAGSFQMGSPDGEEGRHSDGREGPLHQVTIAEPFAVGVYEVTRGQFAAFVEATGHDAGDSCYTWDREWKLVEGRNWRAPGFAQTDEHPVVCVSWNDAKAYVTWLARKTRADYRLLSEAEWEYAARAGTPYRRFWGDDPDDREACAFANSADLTSKDELSWSPVMNCRDGYVYTAPVGTFDANAFGLHDPLGNAWEWVEDCWNASYAEARRPNDGTAWTTGDCSRRVLRGGSWFDGPGYLRSANRFRVEPDYRGSVVGFRVARTLR
jgi:formylglycine-generating enzyme required for sulfatase activity